MSYELKEYLKAINSSKEKLIQIAGDSVNLYNETHHADTIPHRKLEK